MKRPDHVTEKCEACSNVISLPPGMMARRKRAATNGKLYCSRKCFNSIVHKIVGTKRIEEKCGQCGKIVSATPRAMADRKARSKSGKVFCSLRCNGFNRGQIVSRAFAQQHPAPAPVIDANLIAALAAAIAPLVVAQIKSEK